MIRNLTPQEKAEIQAITDVHAASLKTHPTKGKYDFKAKQSNFSSVANFSSDYSDFGSFDGIYDGEDTAEYNAKAREVASMSDIRRLTLAHSIKSNLQEWILKKNNIVKRNRAAKAERQKEFEKRY